MRRRTPLTSLAAILLLALTTIAATTQVQAYFESRRAHTQKHTTQRLLQSAGVPTERLSDVPCTDGAAGPFACDGVDLLSFVPYDEFVGNETASVIGGGLSDIWGWTDPENGDEYAIVGVSNGTAFFRITDPTNPVYLGRLPNTALAQLIWHDIKVYEDHAFIVSESNPHGMRVFDLTRLRGVETAQTWVEDTRYPLNWAAHNIAINPDTGFAYIVGGNEGIVVPDHCQSGLHMVDISDPSMPLPAGCYTGDGYVHDTQCVVYRGPDVEHRDKEICVNSSEDQVSIVDVTDKGNVQVLGRVVYEQSDYTHQGWFTDDQAYFMVGDEGDETAHGVNTRTIVLDVRDLDSPQVHFERVADTASIDHNLYVKDGLVYQSNYTSGLRVLDSAGIPAGTLDEVAFFDTFPDNDDATFHGTWSNYPYFASGTIAVSGIDEGLFLLRLSPGGEGDPDTDPGTDPDTGDCTAPPAQAGGRGRRPGC